MLSSTSNQCHNNKGKVSLGLESQATKIKLEELCEIII